MSQTRANRQLGGERPDCQAGDSGKTLSPGNRKLDKPCRSYRKKRRGASAVEFALVAPVFLLLLLGMIEYGRMVMVQQVITNASREAARNAVLEGATHTSVVSVANTYLTSGSVDNADITIVPYNPEDAEYGDPVTVTIDVDFSEVSWLPSPMYLGGKTMTATTVMRRESVQ